LPAFPKEMAILMENACNSPVKKCLHSSKTACMAIKIPYFCGILIGNACNSLGMLEFLLGIQAF